MTTITSSSKYAGLTAMLRHDLRRTRLMSALFFLLEFIALPLQLALLLFSRLRKTDWKWENDDA